MNSDILVSFQTLILTIEHIEQLKRQVQEELHPEQAKLRSSMLRDMTSTAIKDLVHIGRQARKNNIPLPQKLSYWLLDYVAANLYGLPEPEVMVDAKKHDLENDSLREHNRYIFTVNEILRGYEKGADEGVLGRKDLQKELREFTDGYDRVELPPVRYGYLLASQLKKVSVASVQRYFEIDYFKSSSQVSKLFTRHRLNDVIKKNQSRLESRKKHVPPQDNESRT